MEDVDDLPRRTDDFEPKSLDDLSLDQLEQYIEVLSSEIERVKLEIASKNSVMMAAKSVFKK